MNIVKNIKRSTILFSDSFPLSFTVHFKTALRSRGYFVSRCIGLAKRSVRCKRPKTRLDCTHWNFWGYSLGNFFSRILCFQAHHSKFLEQIVLFLFLPHITQSVHVPQAINHVGLEQFVHIFETSLQFHRIQHWARLPTMFQQRHQAI